MKKQINVKYQESVIEVPVWRGTIAQGYVWRNGEPDLIQSKARYNWQFKMRQLAKKEA
ncbi:MAG: hypothetical protein IIZ78_00675 [Clostridiales bacterium]|nr:hypothetical protein [Clostridiales bacterium]